MTRDAVAITLARLTILSFAVALSPGHAAPAHAPAFHAPSDYPPAVTPWALGVRTKVARTLAAHPPSWAQSAQVAFKVHRDGTVSDVSVTGDPRTAAHVTALMRRIPRVTPFPRGVTVDIIPLAVKVRFVDTPPRKGKRK